MTEELRAELEGAYVLCNGKLVSYAIQYMQRYAKTDLESVIEFLKEKGGLK
jgi:hypothetical protein